MMKIGENMSESLGILGVVCSIVLIVVGIWFAIITSTIITNHLGVTGWDWWIVAITIFGALGGCGGSLINIKRD